MNPPGFAGLLRVVCGQLISDAAAEAIWTRLRALPGAPLTPEGLLALDDAALRGVAGLSRPKAAAARAVASAALDGRLRLADLPAMPDEAAVAHLCAVPGVGPWTARAFLALSECRPDVFPDGDVALATSLAALRGLPARPAPREMAREAHAWRPWRGLAARLLWHHRRHVRAMADDARGKTGPHVPEQDQPLGPP